MDQVAVVIPTRGKAQLVQNCVEALLKSVLQAKDQIELDVVVIEHGGTECRDMIEKTFSGWPVRWLAGEDPWSYSQMNNAAVAQTTAPYLLLLNNDTIPKKGFLRRMLDVLEEKPDVGVVGAKLLFPQRVIQHIGVVFKYDGTPYHLGYGKPDDGSLESACRDDYYEAVTFACALIRRETWDAVGGLDEKYHFNYEDADFCLMAREKGWRSYLAHRAVVIHEEGQSGEHRQTRDHSIERNFKVFYEKWLETGRLTKATGIKLDRRPGRSRPEHLNVAFMSERNAGVPWWRLELPSRKASKLDLMNVAMLYGDMDQATLMDALDHADVLVMSGMTAEWIVRIAQYGHARNFRMVYDCDDHPLYISPFSQAYRNFGCQEIRIKGADGEEVWLWRDGENGFDLKRNQENRARQLEILSCVDLVTTTTSPLYEFFKTRNQHVSMLPNAIDFDLYRTPRKLWERRDGPVRIGWHGGDNHWHDISAVGPVLTQYVNSHDVQLVLFGAYYKGPFRGIDPNKVVEEDWVNVEAFPWKLASLGIDVAVIPLADPALPMMKANHYKSNIKFLEYGAVEVPTLVVDGLAPYSCCVDGENSLTFADGDEFVSKLDRLCRDRELRWKLGRRAHDYVREHFDLAKNVHRWSEAYENLVARVQGEVQQLAAQQAAEDKMATAAAEADAIDAAVPDDELRPARSNAAAEEPQVAAPETA